MVISISVTKPKPKTIGLISRYLVEVDTFLWVGRITKPVLSRIELSLKDEDACLVIHKQNLPQGFELKLYGAKNNKIKDLDGMLFRYHKKEEK